MWYEVIGWTIPVLFLFVKNINLQEIFIFSAFGVLTFIISIIFNSFQSESRYFYYFAGLFFIMLSAWTRYNYDAEVKKVQAEHFNLKKRLFAKIKELEKSISDIKNRINEIENGISIYEMLYSISRILVKQIDLQKLTEGVKNTVFFMRKNVKSFEIYLAGVSPPVEKCPDGNRHFEIPIKIEYEKLGVIDVCIAEYGLLAEENFLDECRIIAHQMALALKRAKLYNLVLERSRTDGLTGIYLRRYFLERLKEEFDISRRYHTFFSFLMFDVDHFKKINDTNGHPVGDEVLKGIAKILGEIIPQGAVLCRYGGEEFAAVIGLSPVEEIRMLAENIKKKIEETEFANNIKTTISIGIAYRHQAENENELIRKADTALYKAKNEGRNRVVEWGE